MKVFFLNPPALSGEHFMKEVGRCGRRTVAGELWPQTGLAYLAAVAIQEHCEIRLIDAMASGETLEGLIRINLDFKPDLVIANTTTPTFKNDAIIMNRLKASHPDGIYAFTGTHVSALPEESLKNSEADLIFIDEAEQTLREAIHKWKKWNDIPGLAYRKGDEILITSPCPYISNLDSLPFPARRLLPNDKYKMPFFEDEPFTTVIPTRGCPWKCIFCRAGKVWGTRIRTRSPENVIAEIREIKKELGIRNIVFMTDSLTLDRKWANAFFEKIWEQNLEFRWICNSRVDAVSPETLQKMKRAGCLLISYGVESGNGEILEKARKNIKPEDSVNAIRWTREAGILSMAYFILGLPGETRKTIEETIRFAKRIDPDYVNFHVATPFPGTELYEMAKEHGWLTSNDWSDYEEEGSAVLRTEELTSENLVQAQKRAMRSFYMRPGRLIREIGRIRSYAQLKARIKAGWALLTTLSRKSH
ncbi:radical SAM protein [Candidatus Sumerlaeota bacterium]|nr:radical SAM protein [Candidatus Sumerlaeota bacterium]